MAMQKKASSNENHKGAVINHRDPEVLKLAALGKQVFVKRCLSHDPAIPIPEMRGILREIEDEILTLQIVGRPGLNADSLFKVARAEISEIYLLN